VPLIIGLSGLGVAQPAKADGIPWGTVIVPGSAWAGTYASLGDLNVYSNGTGDEDQMGAYGLEYECTELASRWAQIAYGDSHNRWDGPAYMFYASGPSQSPPFLQEPNGGATLPEFGDILVFDQTSYDPTGHVAVVTGVSGGYVDIVEQNWGDPNPTGTAQVPIGGDVNGAWDPTYMPPRWGLPIIGWLQSSLAPRASTGVVGDGSPLTLQAATPVAAPAEPASHVSASSSSAGPAIGARLDSGSYTTTS